MIEITSAKQISDYKIEIIFNDKTKGIVDLKNTISFIVSVNSFYKYFQGPLAFSEKRHHYRFI